VAFGVLVVYRPVGADTPVHAVGAEVWHGSERVATVRTVHCVGMVSLKVHQHVQRVLNALQENYGIRKFAAQLHREVNKCPLDPCPHKSVGDE
jgi:hypothetical protein